MTIPIPPLPFFALSIVLFIVSVVMKLIGRGDPHYWMLAAGVCGLLSMAG